MYNFLLKDHHRRTAIIAYQLGNAYGLEDEQLSNLILAASIHDIGALSVVERDQLIKIDVEDPEPHEILGEKIIKEFKPFDQIGKIIRHHHIVHQDVLSGKVQESEVPLECYFLHLADRVDILLTANTDLNTQRKIVSDSINERFGTIFSPLLERTFNDIVKLEDFWDSINQSSFYDLLFMSVDNEYYNLEDNDMEDLALLFARVVDYKSSWTTTHSQSVGILARRIGELLEFDPEICFELKIAGYLHDVGKVGISTEVLDKPGKLEEQEYKMMKRHALYSSLILSNIEGLKNITKWAVNHHEKRDKSGYPMKLSKDHFSIEMDVIAFADIFTALAEDRPYRNGMSSENIVKILAEFVPDQLNESVFQAIRLNIDELYSLQHNL